MFLVGESLAQETNQLISFLYKEGSQLRLNESVHPLHLFYICERKQTNKEKDKQKSQKEHLRSILQHCSFKFVVKL